jgi:SAM-dependent methyltransferase
MPATDARCSTTAAATRSSSDDRRVLTPARRRGMEILDDPAVDPAVRRRSLDDVRRSNLLLGGLRAARRAFIGLAPSLPNDALLLDIGTGVGDIPAALGDQAKTRDKRLVTIGVDEAFSLVQSARARLDHVVCASALALPFRDGSVDVSTCSQVLHHFDDSSAECVLREMDRVTRRAALVIDLRRSRIAALGFWIVSFPLRFSPVTRHDGVLSVFRGFTAADLRRLIQSATGRPALVSHWLGFRLTASWQPGRTS